MCRFQHVRGGFIVHENVEANVFGFIHPVHDVHTLGIVSAVRLLEDCGLRCCIAEHDVGECLRDLSILDNARLLRSWILGKNLGSLGFSYRLDPDDAVRIFSSLYTFLEDAALISWRGGPVRNLYFAGLPAACAVVSSRFPRLAAVFHGDESAVDTLEKFGISAMKLPVSILDCAVYDKARRDFARELVDSQEYQDCVPVDRSSSPAYGKRGERLVDRIHHGMTHGLPPLMRAHLGPYMADRREALSLFLEWTKKLAKGRFLDILSIGTSQLSQSRFGEDWAGAPDGGGVPINTPEEYSAVWEAARPMLVRTYAGTKNVPELAQMYEKRLDIAWHALSFWWFCLLDGRGPNTVALNLEEHFRTMRYIASTHKPLEPNVPHHFAFRGSDDLGYVLSGYVAAAAARRTGIRTLVLQIMLSTPKYIWGLQDLARARVLLKLVRSLENENFRVLLQPRGGLDYFSPEPVRAKEQLAEVTALMDDIEAGDDSSPQIIHVVGYSEGRGLADPGVVQESIKITAHALAEYRRLRRRGLVDDMRRNVEVAYREEFLMKEARMMIAAIERAIPNPYSPGGMYRMLASGVFALPWLTECREEFSAACAWKTRAIDGSIRVVDDAGKPLGVEDRLSIMAEKTGGAAWALKAGQTTG